MFVGASEAINDSGEPPLFPHVSTRVAPGREWLSEDTIASEAEDDAQTNMLTSEVNLDPNITCEVAEKPAMISDRDNIDMECGSASTERAKAYLTDAKRQARLRRWRISAPCLTIGLSMFCCGTILSGYAMAYVGRPSFLAFFANLIVGPGVLMYMLGLLPTDERAVRNTVIIGASLEVILASFSGRAVSVGLKEMSEGQCTSGERHVDCSIGAVDTIQDILAAFTHICIALRFCRSISLAPRGRARMLWSSAASSLLNMAWYFLVYVIVDLACSFHDLLVRNIIVTGVLTTMGALASWPNFRFYFQAWLTSKGESAASAAGVAVLLGGSNIHDIIIEAKNTFRAVSADKLTEADMADNKPNLALREYTEKIIFGQVDAFVSHSWHDDAKSKWRELQDWRRGFKRKHGREPRLWIDKYCIDQANIDSSLRCLPVYLMGCQSLLILCGTTYLQRLWCIVEIFTFKEMGGSKESLECRLLSGSKQIQKEFDNFDVYSSRCFTEHDAARLLGVMEAGVDSIHDLRDWLQTSIRAEIDRCQSYDSKKDTCK